MIPALLLCISLDLYHGPVEPSTPATRLASVCSLASLPDVLTALEACSGGASVCEILYSQGAILLEHKMVDLSPPTFGPLTIQIGPLPYQFSRGYRLAHR